MPRKSKAIKGRAQNTPIPTENTISTTPIAKQNDKQAKSKKVNPFTPSKFQILQDINSCMPSFSTVQEPSVMKPVQIIDLSKANEDDNEAPPSNKYAKIDLNESDEKGQVEVNLNHYQEVLNEHDKVYESLKTLFKDQRVTRSAIRKIEDAEYQTRLGGRIKNFAELIIQSGVESREDTIVDFIKGLYALMIENKPVRVYQDKKKVFLTWNDIKNAEEAKRAKRRETSTKIIKIKKEKK